MGKGVVGREGGKDGGDGVWRWVETGVYEPQRHKGHGEKNSGCPGFGSLLVDFDTFAQRAQRTL